MFLSVCLLVCLFVFRFYHLSISLLLWTGCTRLFMKFLNSYKDFFVDCSEYGSRRDGNVAEIHFRQTLSPDIRTGINLLCPPILGQVLIYSVPRY